MPIQTSTVRAGADEPILLNTAEVGLPRQKILLVGGRTEASIEQHLREHAGDPLFTAGGVSTPAGRLRRIAEAHQKSVDEHGGTDGCCTECGHGWPCPTNTWASGDTRNAGIDCWDPADDSTEGDAA